MAIKTVNALSHYTDGTIGHVHAGALRLGRVHFHCSLITWIPRLYGQTPDVQRQI